MLRRPWRGLAVLQPAGSFGVRLSTVSALVPRFETASFKLLVVEARARSCTRYKQVANIHCNLPLHLFL
jgi:hypothetical protein